MARTQIFISYSHKDKSWLERLQVHLKPLERFGLQRWDDTLIRPGDRWFEEIRQAVSQSRVVILLVSADFLASEFISRKELPDLLKRAADEGAVILPVIVGACLFDETKSLSVFQSVNPPTSPLESLSPGDQNRTWADLARRVQELIQAAPEDAPAGGNEPAPALAPDSAAAPVGNRHALIIQMTSYEDKFYNAMVGAPSGTGALAEVLADPKVGGFTVRNLTNAKSQEARATIGNFLRARKAEDVAIVYFSGLAQKDSEYGLHVIAEDTPRDDLDAAISGSYIQRSMKLCPALLQLVVFDCQFVGSFAPGKIDPDAKVGPIAGFQGEGRFVVSSTNLLSCAWEKDGDGQVQKLRDMPNSFMADMTHGLRTGKPDLDKNLKITVDELFDFLAASYLAAHPDSPPDEGPSRWSFDQSKGDGFVIAEARLPAEEQQPTPRRKRFTVSQDIRRPILDLICPSYILDERYYMLDWNPAFDEIIARPLRLVRGPTHAAVLVREMENSEDVVKHANEVFGGDEQPLVDTEEMVFDSTRFGAPYGRLRFQKLAAQITGNDGAIIGWSVCLNVKSVEREEELFWKTIQGRIRTEVSWSRYAVVYDNLLAEFDEYRALVADVASQVGDAERCLDLGAGTGTGTIELLRGHPEREVWAVELNETMIRYFRAKMKNEGADHGDRVTIIKDNTIRLDGLPPNSFDAAVMINVLYAVDDQEECLRNVNRVLKTGGTLALSTSHRETDVDRLFNALQAALDKKGALDQYQEQVDVARGRHKEMDAIIHLRTIDETVQMLEDAGFTVEVPPRKAYVDAVVVIKAKKTGDPKPRPAPASAASPTDDPTKARVPGREARDVFLSYSANDRPTADAVIAALEGQSIDCFVAPRDITPSSDWTEAVTGAIENCRVVLLILSRQASTSEMVKREVSYAAERGIPIIPFRVEDVAPSATLAFYLSNVHWLDAFPPPLTDHFPRLIESIKFLLSSG